ncbi:hypothetical protein ACN47E_005631 [Coniothyrium glycines]
MKLRKSCLLALSVTVVLYLFSCQIYPSLQHAQTSSITPANSTLGFGTILAVSHAHSPRRPGLLWAANLTDIDIVIPEQPAWTPHDITAFRAEQGSTISNGSARAWLGHLHVLRHFLATTHTTALILEDDVDFSLFLRHTQIPLLAAALRTLLPSPRSYWPSPASYTLLYPGHCDDLPSPATYLSHPSTIYRDPSTPPSALLHPDTAHFLATLRVPRSARVLHRAIYPFCTFAYAVHRASAALILETWARESDAGVDAFDVALLSSCRDRGWVCWSVSPELFHHVRGRSEIAWVDRWGAGAGAVELGSSEESRKDAGRRRALGTWNLECAARHEDLWVEEGDGEGRARAKEVVADMVRKGECVLDKAEEEKQWAGCEWGECGAQS